MDAAFGPGGTARQPGEQQGEGGRPECEDEGLAPLARSPDTERGGQGQERDEIGEEGEAAGRGCRRAAIVEQGKLLGVRGRPHGGA